MRPPLPQPIVLEQADFEVRTACPFCGAATKVSGPDLPLFPHAEMCAAGPVVLAEDVAQDRRLRHCERCTGVFCSHIPTVAATQRINDSPAYLSNLVPDANRLSFVRGWKTIAKYFPDKPGAILDVGACTGDFLRHLDRWKRTALEPSSSSAAALAFTDRVVEGILDGASDHHLEEQDVVTLFDVVEHFRAPRVAFQRLSRIVRRGGFVIIESGDASSAPARAGALWSYVRYLSHFGFFTRGALDRLLLENGFELLEYELVHHSRPTPRQYAQILPRLILYGLVSGAGRRPERWVALGERFGRAAAAPSFPAKDHFYAVARRVR